MMVKGEDSTKIDDLNKAIAEIEAEENRAIIMEQFKEYSENPENIKLTQMWKKIWPKCGTSLPTAKKNHKGKLITGPTELKKLLAKEYKERLRSRLVRPDMRESQEKSIFKMKMRFAGSIESPSWTLADLEKALKDLKKGKSRDHEGFINELFKDEVFGDDLKNSLLMMYWGRWVGPRRGHFPI